MNVCSTVTLRIDKDEAHRIARRTVFGVHSTATSYRVEFRTPNGLLVATISNADTRADSDRATLRYRTGPRMPVLAHGISKARQIRDALSSYAE